MKKREIAIFGLGIALALALAGCPNIKPPTTPSPTPTPDPLRSLGDPTAHFGYAVAEDGSGTNILCYTVNRDGLTLFGTVSIPIASDTIIVHPSLRKLYVFGDASSTGYAYQFNIGVDGKLSPMTTLSVALPIRYPGSVTFHPSGAFAYFDNEISTGIYQLSLGANGAITGTVQRDSVRGYSLGMDRGGRYLYASGSGIVRQYSINAATGAITAMTPASVTGSGQMNGFLTDPSDSYLYGIDMSFSNIVQFGINASGGLSALSPPSFASTNYPTNSAFLPGGRVFYVITGNGIQGYTPSQTNGTLAPGVNTPLGDDLSKMVIDASGQYAFVVDRGDMSGVGAKVHQFGIIDAAGTLLGLHTASVSADHVLDFALFYE